MSFGFTTGVLADEVEVLGVNEDFAVFIDNEAGNVLLIYLLGTSAYLLICFNSSFFVPGDDNVTLSFSIVKLAAS